MPIAGNQAYINQLKAQIIEAADVTVRTVVEEILSYAAIMTVQDSGNAAFHWEVTASHGSSPKDLRGGANMIVGEGREYRRALDIISEQDTLSGLTGRSILAPFDVVEKYENEVAPKITMKSGSFGTIRVVNNIDNLGEGYGTYEYNALRLVKESSMIGVGRGYEKAKTKKEVLRVIS